MTKLMTIAAFALPACAMLAFAGPAAAEAAVAAAAAASGLPAAGVQAKAQESRRVCINVVPDTGSRMARRICRTKAEWADQGVDLVAKK